MSSVAGDSANDTHGAPAQPPAGNPFVGPQPIDTGQPLHGRRRETEELSNLIVGKRVVLLFSPSGAGKTSLIRAGLVPKLQRTYDMQALPIVRLGYRDPEYLDDPCVNRYRLATLCALEALRPEDTRRSARELRDYTLQRYFDECVFGTLQRDAEDRPKCPLLILDQLEELFFDPLDVDRKQAFMAELGELLADQAQGKSTQADATIWALFAIREDRLAELQPYLDLIPTSLSFRYRLDALGVEAACEVIRETGKAWIADDVPALLVEDLCTVSVRGVDGKERLEPGPVIEPVHLQIVCNDLWHRVVTKQGRAIAREDLASQHHSGVNRALGDFYDRVVGEAVKDTRVPERQLREWIETELISPSGVRTPSLPEPATFNDERVIRRLVDAHLLRLEKRAGRDWVELPHDRLVLPIREANSAWCLAHLKPFQLRAKRWQAAEGTNTRQSLLLSEPELLEAQAYVQQQSQPVTPTEDEFLAASAQEVQRILAERRNRRRIRWVVWGSAVAVAGVLVAWALNEGNERREAETRAETYRAVGRSREQASPAAALNGLLELRNRLAADDPDGVVPRNVENGIRQALVRTPAALKRELQPRQHVVWSLAFSDDGQRLYAGSWDGRISVQDLAHPQAAAFVTPDLQSRIYNVLLHDATGLVVSTHLGGRVRLWRWDGKALQRIGTFVVPTEPGAQNPAAALSDDGRWLAIGGWDKRVHVWDIGDPRLPRPVASFRKADTVIQSIAFVPGMDAAGAQQLVSTDYDGNVRLWSIGPGMPQQPAPLREFAIRDHAGVPVGISASAVAPDGRYLVAGDTQGDVHVWDLTSPGSPGFKLARATHRGSAQDTQVKDIAFAPDSQSFVSVGLDGYLVQWTFPDAPADRAELDKRTTARRFRIGERLYSVAYRPHTRNEVAIGGTRSIQWLDLAQGPGPALSRPFPASLGPQTWRALSMDADGTRIAARGKGPLRRVPNQGAPAPGASTQGAPTPTAPIRTDPIRIWQRGSWGLRTVPEWTLYEPDVAFALSPDGQALVTADCRGEPVLWRLRPGAAPQRASDSGSAGNCGKQSAGVMAFSPGGEWLATSNGHVLRLWARGNAADVAWREIATKTLWRPAGGAGEPPTGDRISALSFSPDTQYLAVGSDSGRVYLWSMTKLPDRRSAPVASVDIGMGVSALAFHPSGHSLLAGGDDGFITGYTVPALGRDSVTDRHERSIMGLVFASTGPASGNWISADADGYIVASAPRADSPGASQDVELKQRGSAPVEAIALSRDGSFLVTAGDNLLGWNLTQGKVLDTAKIYADRRYQVPSQQVSGQQVSSQAQP